MKTQIDKKQLIQWLQGISDVFELFYPVQDAMTGVVHLRNAKDTAMDVDSVSKPAPGVPKTSIKTFFMPQPEVLARFSVNSKDAQAFVLKAPDAQSPRRVLLNIRPCDARSVALNAMPYADDPYFQGLLARTVIVGRPCSETCATCFCERVGGSPQGTEGMDVVLREVEDGFSLEALTQKGMAFLEETCRDVQGFEPGQVSEKSRSELPAIAKEMQRKDLLGLYNAPFWSQVAEPCINCGACTFLCPTCYCFDIQDEVFGNKGVRLRYWDSCMFPLFTLHASGHNPRGQKVQRVRNRFMHKFKYFPDRFGPVSCVGCGRCVKDCPVNIDIREVISLMQAV